MTAQALQKVDYLFEEEIRLASIAEFGVSWQEISTGLASPPPEGARFDLEFEGILTGAYIEGDIRGTDYLEVRADGRFMLNIHATITTKEGDRIALFEEGVLTPSPEGNGKARLHLNMKFTTGCPRYTWLNDKQVWGLGNVNMAKGRAKIRAFIA